ncbi:FMN reductase [NAD(P)H] [Propionicimonas paludicola]|uniref:FMN reductase [NAD(P)H] n=1 Tax=Propionicimonas paludicola TaxID=185243 RepID=A0A2A9CVX2_9ACTN|nr:nitroreductase family protein [Propionicimonas paludicola]PFG18165.1 FMN reductase [NAD(P)H] [Propionicimonas paludicola]
MTNPVLEQLTERRSVRAFTGETVKEADLAEIIKATQQAPTSINGQQITLVVVRDKERIARIAELAGQPGIAAADAFVAFVADFNRTAEAAKLAGTEQVVERSAEGILVGAVDAGIALATFQAAAAALGYGTTPIGGIRRNPAEIIALLELPPRTFPIVGSTLGVPDRARLNKVKPRVPVESFAMAERYDAEKVAEGVASYDQVLRAWWDGQGLTQMGGYAQETAGVYSRIYYPEVAATLRAQGFEFTD